MGAAREFSSPMFLPARSLTLARPGALSVCTMAPRNSAGGKKAPGAKPVIKKAAPAKPPALAPAADVDESAVVVEACKS